MDAADGDVEVTQDSGDQQGGQQNRGATDATTRTAAPTSGAYGWCRSSTVASHSMRVVSKT
jgi:hypothetical protein